MEIGGGTELGRLFSFLSPTSVEPEAEVEIPLILVGLDFLSFSCSPSFSTLGNPNTLPDASSPPKLRRTLPNHVRRFITLLVLPPCVGVVGADSVTLLGSEAAMGWEVEDSLVGSGAEDGMSRFAKDLVFRYGEGELKTSSFVSLDSEVPEEDRKVAGGEMGVSEGATA
jgi:hypothetical protein